MGKKTWSSKSQVGRALTLHTHTYKVSAESNGRGYLIFLLPASLKSHLQKIHASSLATLQKCFRGLFSTGAEIMKEEEKKRKASKRKCVQKKSLSKAFFFHCLR